MNKTYRLLSYCYAVCLFVLFSTFAVRFFSKSILVNKFKMNNSALQYIADYTYGDWYGLINPSNTNPDTSSYSNEYFYYQNIYNELVNVESYENESSDSNENRAISQNGTINNPSGIIPLLISNADNYLNRYVSSFDKVKSTITKYSCEKFIFVDIFEKIENAYKTCINNHIVYARTPGTEFDLSNGYVWISPDNSFDKDLFTRSQIPAILCKEKGIDYLRVIRPSRVSPDKHQVPLGANEYSNDNLDMEYRLFSENNLEVYDLRTDMYSVGWTPENGYFRNDGHWNPISGYIASTFILKELNNRFDSKYNELLYNESKYNKITFHTDNYSVNESVDILFPKYPQKEIYLDLQNEKEFSCNTNELLCDKSRYDRTFRKSILDLYALTHINNTKFGVIENLDYYNEQTILIFSNSMSWYIIPYLSMNYKKTVISVITDANQRKYLINSINPDIVLDLY